MELIDVDKTQDDMFIDFFRGISTNPQQTKIEDYTPKAYSTKKTYTQNWKAYDLAKTNETILFKRLLNQLLYHAKLENTNNKGYNIEEKIFCTAIKTYSNSALRKTQSMLQESRQLGYINKVPSYKSLCNFLNDDTLLPILDRLITLTTMPLIHLEKTAAIDASGFSLSKYDRWSTYKWGKPTGKERGWVKAHILAGCNTNIILSAKLSPKHVGDSPVFPILAKEARAHYDIKELCADKAYSSRKNLQFAYELGMIPFIPFKKNSRGASKGHYNVWNKMYHYFKKNEAEFNRHYHKRSNVETCFHMIKQRFGSNLTTKSFIANGVEFKLKVLSHNLCVLIQELFSIFFR